MVELRSFREEHRFDSMKTSLLFVTDSRNFLKYTLSHQSYFAGTLSYLHLLISKVSLDIIVKRPQMTLATKKVNHAQRLFLDSMCASRLTVSHRLGV